MRSTGRMGGASYNRGKLAPLSDTGRKPAAPCAATETELEVRCELDQTTIEIGLLARSRKSIFAAIEHAKVFPKLFGAVEIAH
jgi:hypothetical protein